MPKQSSTETKSIPDHTAVRVALWRALHILIDDPPHVLIDNVALKMADPEIGWQDRQDMHPQWTRGYRASIVGRARLIEDLVAEKHKLGVNQYVILGAGLDSFAQRKSNQLSDLRIFEIDKPETQEWKQKRLLELGYTKNQTPEFVPVDFEGGESWIEKLAASRFDKDQPAVISSTGVSMYLTEEANKRNLNEIARFKTGSTLAMTFMVPLDLIDPAERAQHQMVYNRARAAGTPFLSFFRPEEIVSQAKMAGFSHVEHFSREQIITRYFNDRSDSLIPSKGEEFLIAQC